MTAVDVIGAIGLIITAIIIAGVIHTYSDTTVKPTNTPPLKCWGCGDESTRLCADCTEARDEIAKTIAPQILHGLIVGKFSPKGEKSWMEVVSTASYEYAFELMRQRRAYRLPRKEDEE